MLEFCHTKASSVNKQTVCLESLFCEWRFRRNFGADTKNILRTQQRQV